MRRPHSGRYPLLLAAIALSLLTAAVAAQTARGRGTAQPPARADTLPEGPNYTKYANGLYTRVLSQTVASSKDYSVEEWALLVGPGKTTDTVTLPGSAVLLVRTGSAVVTLGDRRQDVRLGSSLLVPENQRFSIANSNKERPVSIKAVIVKGR